VKTKHSGKYKSNNASSPVNEAQPVYTTSSKQIIAKKNATLKVVKPAVPGAVVILSDATNIPETQMTYFQKMHIIKEGISKADLENFKKKAALDYDKLAKALSVTRATLRFSATISITTSGTSNCSFKNGVWPLCLNASL